MATLHEMNAQTLTADASGDPVIQRFRVRKGWLISIGLVLLFTFASLLLNPYRNDEAHTTRYYLPVMRALDARLFADDPVVSSISRFRSWFYDAVSLAGRAAHLTPDGLPQFLTTLYAISLLGCFACICGIARAVDRSPLMFVLLGLICLRSMGAIVGGDGLFAPTVTHKEASTLFGLAVLWSILSGRYFLGLALLSVTVFIHGLTALHIAWCVVPVLVMSELRFSRRLLAGLALLAASFCAYYAIAARGLGFDAEAAQLFLTNKGSINHIALASQGKTQWLLMFGVLLLAGVSRRYLADQGGKTLQMIERFWISGSIICITVSAAFAVSGDHRLALFQPLRCFTWVTLLALVETSAAAIKVRKQDGLAFTILIATMGFKLAGVFLWVPFLCIAIVYIGAQIIGILSRGAAVTGLRVASVAIVLGTLIGFLLKKHVPLESLQSPLTLILCILAVSTILLLGSKAPATLQLGSAGLFLVLCIMSVHTKASSIDSNWIAMAHWVQNNTQFGDRVLTPPEAEEFRNLSYRSPVSEPMNPLWWVNPKLEMALEARASRVRGLCANGTCDCEGLAELARAWGARYFITEGKCQQPRQPAHQTNNYNLFLVSGTAAVDRAGSQAVAGSQLSR